MDSATKVTFFERAPTPEVVDTEFEGDSEGEIEHFSVRFSRKPERKSEATISTVEEIRTPDLGFKGIQCCPSDSSVTETITGPQGPHLFRSAPSPSISMEIESDPEEISDHRTTRSLLESFPAVGSDFVLDRSAINGIRAVRPIFSSFSSRFSEKSPAQHMNLADVAWWTPKQVTGWMHEAGVDLSVATKFEVNDISGTVLISMIFEDLGKLNISSYTVQKRLWMKIQLLQAAVGMIPSQIPEPEDQTTGCSEGRTLTRSRSQWSLEKRHRKVSTVESNPLSIIGIEQMMPKVHRCSKGERCSKWRKQQRLIEHLNEEHPGSKERGWYFISDDSKNLSRVDGVEARYRSEATVQHSHLQNATLEKRNSMKHYVQPQITGERFAEQCELETSRPLVRSMKSATHKGNSPHQMDRPAALFTPGRNCSSENIPVTDHPSATRVNSRSAPPNVNARDCASTRHPSFEKVVPRVDEKNPLSTKKIIIHASEPSKLTAADISNNEGWMMKRKTKLLRHHEWNPYYFRLKGTLLSLYKDEHSLEVLEEIDMDEHAVACTPAISSVKLALKSMISRDMSQPKLEKQDPAAFPFQLNPAPAHKKGSRAALAAFVSSGSRYIGFGAKKHYLAVKSRDERVDLMRELMLSKALKMESKGYQVVVNGDKI